MNCIEFRQVLDLYVDGELSAEAMASASVHLNECEPCSSVVRELLRLRAAVKQVVSEHKPPPELVGSVRQVIASPAWRVRVPALVVLVLVISLVALGSMPGARAYLADGMELVAFRLDTPQTLVLEGEVVCRDCELHALYGAPIMCKLKGHHGALRTASGKIWNLRGGDVSDALIYNASLMGKKVRIRGKLYRRAGCFEVESYEVL